MMDSLAIRKAIFKTMERLADRIEDAECQRHRYGDALHRYAEATGRAEALRDALDVVHDTLFPVLPPAGLLPPPEPEPAVCGFDLAAPGDHGETALFQVVPRRRAPRVTANDILAYIWNRDGSVRAEYLVRDLYAGHKSAVSNANAAIARLEKLGDVHVDRENGVPVVVTIRRMPKEALS